MADIRSLVLFCHVMGSMIHAGLDYNHALVIMQDEDIGNLGPALKRTYEAVQMGSSLSEAMRVDEKIYTPELVNAVYVTEQTGNVDVAFDRMAERLERKAEINNKVTSALFYPAFVLIVFLSTVLIVARSWGMLKEALGFVFLILVVIAMGAALAGSGGKLITKNELISKFLVKLPYVGYLVYLSDLSDFAGNMAVFYDCGVYVAQGMEYSLISVRSEILRKKILRAIEGVNRGNPLSEALMLQGVFPPEMIKLIKTGEDTGDMSDMLRTIEKYYYDEVKNKVDMFMAIFRRR